LGVELILDGGQIVPGVPNADANLCGDPLSLVVQLRASSSGQWRADRRRIKLRAFATSGRTDSDVLLLFCQPSTCGNGSVESDHEQCDDGNRANGDGCDQGCQRE